MISKLLAKLFGANYRTSLTGIGTALFGLLTTLAALPYQLGDIATIIPADYKAKVFTVGAVSTAILRVWNSVLQKDKSVSGGNVQQDKDGNVATPQVATPAPPKAALPK